MNRRSLTIAAVTAAVVGGVAGGLVASMSRKPGQAGATPAPDAPTDTTALQSLKTYPTPRIIADFALRDKNNQPFNLSRWQGRWHLVFFGFTHCPDICPSTLSLMNEVLAAANLGSQLGLTFISVDPDRDTPDHLKRYVDFFNPDFTAATGPTPQLVALTHQMGVLFDIEPHAADAAAYNVDHSAAVLLINPQARLVGQFPAPHDISTMVADLQQVISG